ncbi:hypothetical protein R9C00_21335 [Flammeovirgaceae bacterium SG7u.111]|nr:hypothetical protein [Flammeovirgaceae bacterium SG7u.132]WPO34246.1 hypothetical protein R9C00_21335 [Flammeovirgaceae bacterium SG7u.111]
MIDKNNRNIKLSDSFSLKPFSILEAVENQHLSKQQEIRDMGNGWVWLDVKNVKVRGNCFIFSLCFLNKELVELSFIIQDNPFELNPSWNSWNKQAEQNKLKHHQKWLKKELGNERDFHWGKTWVNYDSKGGFSSIGIRYSKN